MPWRQLRGVELGFLAVGMASVALWLAIPRPVEPGDPLPLPRVDRRQQRLERAADRERVTAAQRSGLSYDVRAVGELVRRYGAREARGDVVGAERAREDAFESRRTAQAREGAAPLRALRALQTELFLANLQRAPRAAADERELGELAGNFAGKARRAGWLDAGGKPRLSSAELRTLYRVRWTGLVRALDDPELGLKLADVREYYRVLLEHPEGDSARERDERRLAYIEAFSRRDRQFFGDFARGVILARLGQVALSVEAFSQHLRAHPDGPWALRARNYLLSQLAEASLVE
jgi:hypothetical protein